MQLDYLTFLSHPLILDTTLLGALGGAELLKEGQLAAEKIAANWDELWKNVITPSSGLYVALTRMGVLFAVGSLMIWGMKIVKDIVEKDSSEFVHEIIWPLIVVFFLSQNGLYFAGFTLGIRDIINRTNQDVLATTSATITLQEAFQKAKNNATAQSEIGALLGQCQALTGQKQIDCLQEADNQAQDIIEAHNLDGNWIIDLHNRVQDAIVEAQQTGENTMRSGFGALIGAGITARIRSILISLQVAFQQLMEVSLLLTALLGPLAIGGSILPGAGKAVYAWLTAMFSVGMAKLCFNIVSGLAAATIVQADAGDPLWFLLFVSLLAPFLSLALAGGGGMAVWSSITSVGAWVATQIPAPRIVRPKTT